MMQSTREYIVTQRIKAATATKATVENGIVDMGLIAGEMKTLS